MSWWSLVRAVLVRWRIAALVGLAVFVGVWAFVGSLPDVYSARAVVSFTPRLGAGVGAQELRAILPSYVVHVSSPGILNGMAKITDVMPEKLDGAVAAHVVADSSNVSLDVSLGDPVLAARVANALAGEVVQFAVDDVLFSARVVAHALPDDHPSGPARGLFLVAGFFLAAMCGVGSAVGLERVRPRVRTWPEVAHATGHRVIGRVPSLRNVDGADRAFGSAIRSVRASLARQEVPVRVLVVTSSVPGEGKTTLAVALATALVRGGQSVLLVDADVRGRGLSRQFGLRPGTGPGQRPGLAEVLSGVADLDAAVRPGPVAGLSVLPASTVTEGSDRLSTGFPGVIGAARERFEVVVVDAGSLLVSGEDAEAVAAACDAALLVVGRDTPAHLAAEAADMLRSLHVSVLGAVANGTRDPWIFAQETTTTDSH